MFRRLLVLLCVAVALYARVPRAIGTYPLRTLDGKELPFSTYKGKVLVVAIFDTGCADCAKTIQVLAGIQKEMGPRGVQVLGAAANEKAKAELPAYITRYHPGFPIGFIPDPEAVKRMADWKDGDRAFVVPVLLFVDKGGIVRTQVFGDDDLFLDQGKNIKSMIEGLLK